MGPLSRDEKLVAVAFVLMVAGWVMAGPLKLDSTGIAFAGLGALLATSVLTLDDIKKEGGTLETYLWLAVLFAMSGQLNELGFMGYVGGRMSAALEGVAWPAAYVALVVLYVLMHYLFVSQSSHALALLGVFVEVGTRRGCRRRSSPSRSCSRTATSRPSRRRAGARTSSSSAPVI